PAWCPVNPPPHIAHHVAGRADRAAPRPLQDVGAESVPNLRRRRRTHGASASVLTLVLALALVATACGGSGHHPSTAATRPSTIAATVPSTTVPATTTTPVTTTVTTTRATTTTRRAAPASTTTAPPSTAARPNGGGLQGVTIVVDPGHNGANGAHPAEINRPVDAGGFQKPCNTTGTAEGAATESAVNLQMAFRLKAALEALGARVVLTRADNAGWGPCIDQRGLLARQVGAAALVSLHADGAGSGQHGFHVIHPGAVPGYTDGIVEPSSRLATLARDRLVAAGLQPSNYVGQGGLIERTDLGTLNRAGVPAIMLEAGNMHDPGDLGLVTGATGQDRVAHALADALSAMLHR
ncbi:MAG: N-acetylmuramoyl-L-alanine amidase, partial [Acidimicrobiales bacterium]|nr:N-acetylmuramoyl-L-alanine amidase [Acidimicrobiales bacterium]